MELKEQSEWVCTVLCCPHALYGPPRPADLCTHESRLSPFFCFPPFFFLFSLVQQDITIYFGWLENTPYVPIGYELNNWKSSDSKDSYVDCDNGPMACNNMFYGCYGDVENCKIDGHEDAGSISNVLMDCHVEGSRKCEFDCDGDACSVEYALSERSINWVSVHLSNVKWCVVACLANKSQREIPTCFRCGRAHSSHPLFEKTNSLTHTEWSPCDLSQWFEQMCGFGTDTGLYRSHSQSFFVTHPTVAPPFLLPFLLPFPIAEEPSFDISFESP